MKPILFSTPMVQSILDGRKTMTRRVVKNKGKNRINENGSYSYINKKDKTYNGGNGYNIPQIMIDILSPYQVGDVLWVRETWARIDELGYEVKDREPIKSDCIMYKTDFNADEVKRWKPSIFMQKEACRIFLRVTNVRVERLQDISVEDILKEGISHIQRYKEGDVCKGSTQLKREWQDLWNSINGKGAWEANQFVFVYEFERVEKPN